MEEIMKLNHRNSLAIGFLLLLSLVACGQRVKPATQTNPSGVETALASTARALAKQTETAQGFTPTPPVIPSETLTPTPKVSSLGTSLEKLADGSTRFTDYTAGIQVVFPTSWLAIRVGEAEYYQAWDKEAVKVPVFQDIFVAMQNTDPNLFRVTAVDMRSEVTYDTFSKMEIVFAPDDQRTVNEIRISQTKKKYPLTKFKLLSSRLEKSPDGFDTAVIEFQWESKTPQNESSLNYHKEIIFKTPSGAIAIQLFTELDRKDSVMLEFDKVVDSVMFLDEKK
jgi:hypothetical protein